MDARTAERWGWFIGGVLVGRLGLYFLIDQWRVDYCLQAARSAVSLRQLPDDVRVEAERCIASREPDTSEAD
jgi:hypothetical protein